MGSCKSLSLGLVGRCCDSRGWWISLARASCSAPPGCLRVEYATTAPATGGAWNTAANWSGGIVPANASGNTFDVTIDSKTVVRPAGLDRHQ